MRSLFATLAIASPLLAAGCGGGSNAESFEAQAEAFDRQAERIDKMHDLLEVQNERYQILLEKWEEQARRMDAVLDAQEKNAGIKPAKP